MLYLIEPHNYDAYREDLDNMYRFRHRIFFDKLNWDVNSQDDMEKDEYDEKETYYLIYKDEYGIIRGCVRFIEMTNNCMFDGPFRDALPNVKEFKRQGYWEATRLAIDTNTGDFYSRAVQQKVVNSLLGGLMEFGLKSKKVECYVVFTYPSVQKLAKKYGLLNYDINVISADEGEVAVWAYVPLTYSYNKLIRFLYESTDPNINIICNLNQCQFVHQNSGIMKN